MAQEARVPRAVECPSCAEWSVPQQPFGIFGNSYYVGTHGLSAILLTSDAGHVLIDGALPESAPAIISSIRALGFRVEDLRLILNSHAHYDHAGGIAELQRASGARVAASPWSAGVLTHGQSEADDPQYGILLPYPGVTSVTSISDGDTLRIGSIAVTAHLTPGHTPGGTTWTWRSCEGTRCLDIVYADSQSPISSPSFLYSASPAALSHFERSYAVLEHVRCDILVTPHPRASEFLERSAARDSGGLPALVDQDACRRFAAKARETLAQRLAAERNGK
ncbi:HARLDQ motif MBL-fold protein [soil metagenome]